MQTCDSDAVLHMHGQHIGQAIPVNHYIPTTIVSLWYGASGVFFECIKPIIQKQAHAVLLVKFKLIYSSLNLGLFL